VPTNKQRRDTARRHLERQLQRRAEREARRRRVALISTIAGTIALIAVIIVAVVWLSSGNDTKPAANKKPSTSPTSSVTTPTPAPTTSYPAAKGAAVTFNGVTVKGATDLKGYPVVTSKGSGDPKNIEVKDLVTGKGASAKPGSSVTVQYYGALYKNGQYFDSSWKRGQAATFTLKSGPGGVIAGFTEGIGGTKGIAGMKVGGRRIIIMPSALGYGKTGSPPTIPPNSPLVFVVDLKAVS
jgi:peptidylprolyl isomerase